MQGTYEEAVVAVERGEGWHASAPLARSKAVTAYDDG